AAKKAEDEKKAIEKAEKEAAEKAEKEAKKKAEEEKKAQEKAEKEAAKKAADEKKAQEKAEKEAAKKAEEEKKAQEKAEKEAAAAAAAAQKAEEERVAKEKADQEAAQAKTEQEAKEKAEKEAAEKKAEEERIAQAAQEAAEAAAAATAAAALEAEAMPKDSVVEEEFLLKRDVNQFAENEGKKGKKSKKNKKNSESETNGQTIEDVDEIAYKQTVLPSETSQEVGPEAADDSHNESKKSKKNKKGGKTEEPKVVEPVSNGHQDVEEIDYKTKVAVNGEEPKETAAQASPPLQVHEITSTAEEKNNVTVLHAQKEIENPTQFAQEVEKLVSETLKGKYPDISVTDDDSMKMTIDAQLLKLAEKPNHPIIEHKPIVLACDRLVLSRPSTPSRDRLYKLLPKDIIFCSSLIDKYGEDFNAMAKDESNVYRENARSLQRKIRIFKESPHFAAYTTAKAEGKTVTQYLEENPE
ncbi:hypothetical protein PFISCL1PPCAC_27646, partial [Pristionchus fissidentatus]